MTITLTNQPSAASFPVTISTSINSTGDLELSCNGTVLASNEQLFVRHQRISTSDPVVVPITITTPGSAWQIGATHENDSQQEVTWNGGGSASCLYTWSETDHEYAVVVTAQPSATNDPPKKKTVYIKVRPEPDLPDR